MHHKRKNSKRTKNAPLRSKWNQPLWFRRQQRNVRRDRQREIEIPVTFIHHCVWCNTTISSEAGKIRETFEKFGWITLWEAKRPCLCCGRIYNKLEYQFCSKEHAQLWYAKEVE